MNNPLIIDENNINQTYVSGENWLNFNLKISHNFFDNIFPFKNVNVQNKKYDVFVDKLADNIESNKICNNQERSVKSRRYKNNRVLINIYIF